MQATKLDNTLIINNEINKDKFNIDKATNHLSTLHNKSKGYITVASKNPEYSQWHYTKDSLINRTEEIIEWVNAYVSQNTFYKPQRRIENIKQLRAVYIDIDCYNSKYTKEAVQYFLENDLYGYKIPRPNYLIDSGRGLYYVILIKPVPHSVMPLWYAVQRYLYNELKEFGADAKALDPTRILRIVGTMNSKSGTMVEVLDEYDYEYTLKEIQEGYLPDITTKKKKTTVGRPKKVVSLYNEYTLYHARVQDIIKLCELRDYDMYGHREEILFLYRYFTACFTEDTDEALSRSLELNDKFKYPLSEREVIRDTESATKAYYKRLYKYSNEKLIELLEITEEEQKQLRTIIGTAEKYRRNNAKRTPRNSKGLTKKQQELEILKSEVMSLSKRGRSIRDIANILGISKSKISRLIDFDKK